MAAAVSVAAGERLVSERGLEEVSFDFEPHEVTHKTHSSAMPMADIRVMIIRVYRIRAQYSSFLGRYANTLPDYLACYRLFPHFCSRFTVL